MRAIYLVCNFLMTVWAANALLNETCPASGCDVTLIIAGPSGGSGVSFWGNVIANEDNFNANSSIETTTKFVESIVRTVDQKLVNIVDTPAHMPGSPKNMAIDHYLGSSDAIVLYVFGSNNGRVSSGEIASFEAFQTTYNVDRERVVFLKNNIMLSLVANETYRSVATDLYRSGLNWPEEKPLPLFFAPSVDGSFISMVQAAATLGAVKEAVFNATAALKAEKPRDPSHVHDFNSSSSAAADSSALKTAHERIKQLEASLRKAKNELEEEQKDHRKCKVAYLMTTLQQELKN